jgi:hypothetical protein
VKKSCVALKESASCVLECATIVCGPECNYGRMAICNGSRWSKSQLRSFGKNAVFFG